MNRYAAVEMDFAGEERTFRLSIGGIVEIEENRNCSLFELVERLNPIVRRARLKDISEVLRVGLIGGGAKPVDAAALTKRYVDERPIDENRDIAYAVALAGLQRVHGDSLNTAEDGADTDAAEDGADEEKKSQKGSTQQ